jgi:hypothetical protein
MEIDISHYNEKLKYEREMDSLRALIIWATGSQADIPAPACPSPESMFSTLSNSIHSSLPWISTSAAVSTRIPSVTFTAPFIRYSTCWYHSGICPKSEAAAAFHQ